jgi:DNA polymerase III delta subunit
MCAMSAVPEAWLKSAQALVHGEDSDGRCAAVEAWKARHVDPEWTDFSLAVCREGCLWPEVVAILSEAAPMGVARVVVVPQADNLLAKPKDLPPPVLALLKQPIPDTRLLLVCRGTLAAGPGRPLGSKPWSDWVKSGQVLKAGLLDAGEAIVFVDAWCRERKLQAGMGVASLLASRLGGHPGILRRTLEVLDLLAEDRRITEEMVDQTTFRLAEQNAFAWSQAWQKGQAAQALAALRLALEDDPAGAPLQLLGQARREAERLARLQEALALNLKGPDLLGAVGLSPKQEWLLGGLQRTIERLKSPGLRKLFSRINQADRDLKGTALSGANSVLSGLTLELCRAWGSR